MRHAINGDSVGIVDIIGQCFVCDAQASQIVADFLTQ
jgi:hypothetical protein